MSMAHIKIYIGLFCTKSYYLIIRCSKGECVQQEGLQGHQVDPILQEYQELRPAVTMDNLAQNVCECECEHGAMVAVIFGSPMTQMVMENLFFPHHQQLMERRQVYLKRIYLILNLQRMMMLL